MASDYPVPEEWFLARFVAFHLHCSGNGLFFTSDSLSEEKREGTLGFLFLKICAVMMSSPASCWPLPCAGFFRCWNFFRIVATTLLMGGVTGTEFWKTSIALLNALFFSAAGIFVSAISRDSQRALMATLFLMLFFIFAGPWADGTIAYVAGRGFQPLFSLSSPGYLFQIAGGWGRTLFWPCLATTQAIAWMLFAFACFLIPHLAAKSRKNQRCSEGLDLQLEIRHDGALD